MKTLNQTEITSISGAMSVQIKDIDIPVGSVSAITLGAPAWLFFLFPQNIVQIQGEGIHIGSVTFTW